GMTASMATILLTAGEKGKRFAMPNATIHMHQALGGARGQAVDVEIMAKELLRENELIRQILVKHTGQDGEKIRKDFDRDFFMTAEQAKAYGIIDEILSPAETDDEDDNGKSDGKDDTKNGNKSDDK
ncbi:MAG: ATP-dependent Clp protease proteolytic subunit, partial [Chloroflexi bacterium]|nr:ATP-dependent Clp protease proteolytic subunit [Chloroflexota bacterium]